jgi:hypothetical protein
MRLGCLGCFVLIVVGLGGLVIAGGALFLSTNIFGTPDVHPVSYTPGDGHTAQQKLYEVLLRQAGRSGRKDPIVLTDREANAFVAQHLAEVAGVPVTPLIVKFTNGQFFAQGQTTLRNLLRGAPFSYLLGYVPSRWPGRSVWVTVQGQLTISGGPNGAPRYGDVTVTQLTLGRQPLHSFLLYMMMGPSGAGLFHWRVPSVVDQVQIQDGRAIIHTR